MCHMDYYGTFITDVTKLICLQNYYFMCRGRFPPYGHPDRHWNTYIPSHNKLTIAIKLATSLLLWRVHAINSYMWKSFISLCHACVSCIMAEFFSIFGHSQLFYIILSENLSCAIHLTYFIYYETNSAVVTIIIALPPKFFAGALTFWYFTSFCNFSRVFTP